MPVFIYTAKSAPGKTIQGNIEAESESDAVNKLSKMGYFPILVKPQALLGEKEGIARFQKISHKDLVLFTRQLSTLVESGVNILNALNILISQSENKYLKTILSDVSSQIKDGKSLSDSLATYPHLFTDLYSAMIRTGEASGNLQNTLRRLADFLEAQEEFRNAIRASLTYPIFVFGVGVLTVFVLLTFVVPRLVTMFEDLGQALPLPTRILISTSGFLRNWWWVIIILISLSIFVLRRITQNPQARLSLDRLKLKTAIFGQLILKSEISRLSRTLSLLLASGVTITPALEISGSVVNNRVIKSEISRFKEEIGAGASLSSSFKSSKFFPEFTTNIVSIGEETGALDKALLRISEEYERDIDRTMKALIRMLEPVIILIMGLIVGFIVLSMLLPIFQINLIAQ